jgi:YegS/Rv2252/BmrU family lipid kinase
MTAEFTFIMNPMAGKGAGRRSDAALEDLLRASGLRYRVVYTEGLGDATMIARRAKTRVVVAVGGDGTVNEVVNALAGTEHVMGIIPTGSGNDLIKSVGIPHSMEQALAVLKAGQVRIIDVGKVQTGRREGGSIVYAPWRLFANGVGIGFDAAVARRVAEITYLRGTLLYLAAVLQIVGTYRSPEFSVRIDGRSWTGRELLMAVGNGKCAGGGFYLSPGADVADGYLDVTVVSDAPVIRILGLIPGVMRGKEVNRRFVTYSKFKELEASSSDAFNVHADGEIVGREVHGVRVGIEPGVLKVIAGGSGTS